MKTDKLKEFNNGFKVGDQIGNGYGKFYTIKKHYTGSFIDIDKDKVWEWFQSKQQEKIERVKKLKVYTTELIVGPKITTKYVDLSDVLSILEEE